MPLCEYFVASSAELETVAQDGSPGEKLRKVDAKGFDMIPIQELAKRLRVRHALEEGEPIVHGEEFEWFAQRVTKAMLDALAKLPEGELAGHAKALSTTVGWKVAAITSLLATLAELSRDAKENRKSLYMWVCT